AELGGAHVLDVGGLPHPEAERAVPRVDLATAPRLMAALHAAIGRGLVRACHDLSEGGLAVAAAEMAIAGRLGLDLELARVPRDEGVVSDALALFAESTSRFLCEVRPEDAPAFEEALAGLPHARVGGVVAEQRLVAYGLDGAEVLRADVARLTEAWQGTKVV
ncbi:MAG: AIR synthase-related protein, partial [Chloroflexota bacterium]